MAECQQMLSSEVRTIFVVNAHKVGIHPVQLTIDDDHWRTHSGQALPQVAVCAHRSDQQAIDTLFQQHTQVTALLLRVVI
ncbi:hypothetical protein D3C71_2099650 [compost metagenome]